MQIARIEHHGPDGAVARIVVAADEDPDRWVDVRAAERLRLERRGASAPAARRVAEALVPGSLSAALETGEAFLDAARGALQARDEAALAPAGARLLAPIDPVAYRDAGEHLPAGTACQSAAAGDLVRERAGERPAQLRGEP